MMTMNETKSMFAINTAQLEHILTVGIPARKQYCIVGASGIGKSQIIRGVFNKLLATVWASCGADFLLMHPVTSEPTDIKGLPVMTVNGAQFEIYGDMRLLVEATRPLLVFIDDMGQAATSMQAALMQLVEARCVNTHKVSDFVIFVAATNDRGHRAGVTGLLDTLKKRFTMLFFVPDYQSWALWAAANGINPKIIAFLRATDKSNPEYFYNNVPTTDMSVNANVRGWERVSETMKLPYRPDVHLALFTGDVGMAAGTDFTAFVKTYDNMVPAESVFADPHKAPIPADSSSLWALTTQLAHKVSNQTMLAYLTYMERLRIGAKRDYVMYSLDLMTSRDPTLQSSKAFVDAMTDTPLGRLMTEAR